MTRSIAAAIAQNADLDIVRTFNSLCSQLSKVRTIEQVIDLCRQRQNRLVQYRCLLTLARLLEELTKTAPLADRTTFLALFQRCSDLGLIPVPFRDPAETSLSDLIDGLSSTLRAEAARHLRAAIVALCPSPRNDLAASKHAPCSFRNVSIRTLAPVRLDLGMGGISDIPPYSLERYGNCINVPVQLNGSFPLEARAEVLPEAMIQFVSKDLGARRTYCNASESDSQPKSLLFHQQVVRFFMSHILGLSTAEELYCRLEGGLRLETYSRLPVGTGLGVSSLLLCAIMKALGSLFDIALTPQALFVGSVYLENAMDIGGGWEDGTAIYPGVKLMESFPETPLSPRLSQLSLNDLIVEKIRKHLVLVYTAIPKQGQAFFDEMVERYCLGETHTLRAIERNNVLNREQSQLLVAGDLAGIGQVMQSQWENWKFLSEGKCTNPQIDRLFAEVAPYVHGARMNGSGQGGCAMFIAREGKEEKLAHMIRDVLGESVIFYKWEPIL